MLAALAVLLAFHCTLAVMLADAGAAAVLADFPAAVVLALVHPPR